MIKYLCCSVLLHLSVNIQAQTLRVDHLQCEYQTDAIGVDVEAPILNWQLKSDTRNTRQTSYRILVSDDSLKLVANRATIWDSGKIRSDRSIQVQYQGKSLTSVKKYYWKVMVWDNQGRSAWSKIARWQMGLLNTADWKNAKWIGYEKLPDSLKIFPMQPDNGDPKLGKRPDVLPLLRKEVILNKQIKNATIFICGLGQFELSMNGKKVGDHFLDPGWTKYDKQAQYVTFDITKQLRQGKNAFGIMLGNGFYYIPGERYRKITGAFGYPKVICRIALQYKDGSTQDIISDASWRTAPGPVTFSSIYGGEDHNANLEQQGWDEPAFNDNEWRQAVTVDGPPLLTSQAQSPLKIFERFLPQKITQPKPGIWVYDLGQNASAIPAIMLQGKKGSSVKITPGELLADDGTVTQNYIGSPVNFNYTLKGGGVESWQPRFMYYGFRYVQIERAVPAGQPNVNAMPVVTQLRALHTRNAAERIGSFNCSNTLFNRTFTLIDWAIQSNTASVFTDCPHREKLGWLEEAHLVGSSIRYTYDIASLCRKVITDMRMSQTADGLIPDIAPEYVQFGGGFRDSPEWGSNGVILPWYVYQWYGDKQVLQQNYDMMTRYVAYLEKLSKKHILSHGLGDWYDIGPKEPGVSQLTPRGVTATAIYYYDLTILSKVASVLGKPADVKKYDDLALEVKNAYNAAFFNKATNQYGTGSQTANAMSVYMGLAEPQDKQAVIDNIVNDLRKRNNSLTAGDIGYRYLLRALDDAGRSDVIFDMNSRYDVPGYGYQLARGATSLTESWQGNRISSNDHFMLGHLMEWFYSGLGGIRAAAGDVAFHDIEIRPEVVGDVKYVNASYRSPYGMISVNWKKTGKVFNIKVVIPANSNAIVYLPATSTSKISEGGKPMQNVKSITNAGYQNGRRLIRVGSGTYNFAVTDI